MSLLVLTTDLSDDLASRCVTPRLPCPGQLVPNLRLLQRTGRGAAQPTTPDAEVDTHMIEVNEAPGIQPVARLGDFHRKAVQHQLASGRSAPIERRRPSIVRSSRLKPRWSGCTSRAACMSGETR